jgi:rfaE bifunctional protein kinase chain/domain
MMNEKELLAAMRDKRVAIVGDVMLDRYITGRVNRMSPEAPVPVLMHDHTVSRLGGAANVALNIKLLGSSPCLCSVIGDDEAGRELMDLMKDLGSTNHFMTPLKGRKTTVKTRLLGNNQHLLRLDSESNEPLTRSEADHFLEGLKVLMQENQIEILILQDYNKGLLTDYLISQIMNFCEGQDIFVSVDPKFDNFFSYKNVDLFKPNLKEICQALGSKVLPYKESLDSACSILIKRINPGNCMITLSEKGIYLASQNSSSIIVPVEVDEIVDVCGAGDAVLAVSSLMLAAGLGAEQTGVVANKAGRIVCQKVGVAPITFEELIKDE